MDTNFKKLKNKFHRFLILVGKNINLKPWLVVILMHEYYRNLFPADPYLPFNPKISHLERISSVLDNSIEILQKTNFIDSYFVQATNLKKLAADKLSHYESKTGGRTQQVYDMLWKKFDIGFYSKETKEIILERFKNSGFSFKSLKGKIILDSGCGSGRYTIALALITGAKKIYGVDLDKESIKRAEKITKMAGMSNIEFKVADVLRLPFRDNSFDFVFCNGVLHHTKNMEKGIKEMYRVLKPKSRAYLYIYGDGGLYWYSRKKVPVLMKKIPQEYTMGVLDLFGLPSNRFIFTDNWYVPRERHTKREYLESYLKKVGFSNVKKFEGGRSTDLESVVVKNREGKIIWGEGEHRYFITK